MDFLANMPIFFWVVAVLAGIGSIYGMVVNRSTRRGLEQAEEFAQTGRWEDSASIYRQLILDRLDFPRQAAEAADSLAALYRERAVDADLTALEESMRVLLDIDRADVSDRQKAQMRRDLHERLAPMLRALPPAVEETSPAPPAPGSTRAGNPERLDAACSYCGEQVRGMAWQFSDYAENEELAIADITGYACPECGAVSHKQCDGGIVFKIWSGYEKSVCKRCAKRVAEPTVIFPVEAVSQ